MPSDLANYFVDTKRPIIKMTYSVNEADYQLVKRIFIEHGFMQYFPGYSIRLLAEALKKEKVTDFMDRVRCPALANASALSVLSRKAWEQTLIINPDHGVGQTKIIT